MSDACVDLASSFQDAVEFLNNRRLPEATHDLQLNFQTSTARVTDKDLKDLARSLPAELSAFDLNLDGCKGVTDAGVASLTEALPQQLEKLFLSCADCEQLSDDSLLKLINSLPDALQICNLNMRGCKRITDKGVAFFSKEALPSKLSTLKLCVDETSASENAKDSLKELEATIQKGKTSSTGKARRGWRKDQDEEEETRMKETLETRKRMSELAAFAGFAKFEDEAEKPPVIENSKESQVAKDQPPSADPPANDTKPTIDTRKVTESKAAPKEEPKASPQKAVPKVARQKAKSSPQKSGKGKGKSKGKSVDAVETTEAETSSIIKLIPIGAYVRASYCGAEVFGRVLFVGTTSFAPGEWIGIDLDEPKTNHDGLIMDVRYFSAKASCGLFARASATEQISEPEGRHSTQGSLNDHIGNGSVRSSRKHATNGHIGRELQKSYSSPALNESTPPESPRGRSPPASPRLGLPSSPPWSATAAALQKEDRKRHSVGSRFLNNPRSRRAPLS